MMVSRTCHFQRISKVTPGLCICPGLQEHSGDFNPVVVASLIQGGASAIRLFALDVGFCIQKQLHAFEVTVPGCPIECAMPVSFGAII